MSFVSLNLDTKKKKFTFVSFDHYVVNKEWSNPIIKHRLQDAKIDTYNCGVFVCCFLERLQELNFDLESELSLDDLKNKRLAMSDYLKRNSDSASIFCAIFGVLCLFQLKKLMLVIY